MSEEIRKNAEIAEDELAEVSGGMSDPDGGLRCIAKCENCGKIFTDLSSTTIVCSCGEVIELWKKT